MKKIISLTLAALMLLVALTSCRMPPKEDPFKEIFEENPEMELPKSEAMEVDPDNIPKYEINDVIKDYDDEEIFDVPANGDYAEGELVVKYKICDYNKENVAIVSIENHSAQPLTIRITGYCEDTLLEKTKPITRTFYGFAAGWQNYFVFPPQVEFDEFWYELEFEPYEGNTYGQYLTNLEWQDISLIHLHHEADGRVFMMPLWMFDWASEESAKSYGNYVLLNDDGEVAYLGRVDKSFGSFDPDSGWKRAPIYAGMECDYDANFYDLGFSYNNSFGSCCAYFPASDAYEASGYELPEKYQDCYGIICFTGFWDEETPESEKPPMPAQSLYASY